MRDWAAALQAGEKPFAHFRDADIRTNLRRRLEALGVKHFHEYGLHSFRRGHAMDLLNSGADLVTILTAGGCKSCAFAAYLEARVLEMSAVAVAQGAPARAPVLQALPIDLTRSSDSE